jgi:hypothetical protein
MNPQNTPKASKRFTLVKRDYVAWAKQVALVFAPTALVILTTLYANIANGGKLDWQVALGAGTTSLILSAIDITRKFIAKG